MSCGKSSNPSTVFIRGRSLKRRRRAFFGVGYRKRFRTRLVLAIRTMAKSTLTRKSEGAITMTYNTTCPFSVSLSRAHSKCSASVFKHHVAHLPFHLSRRHRSLYGAPTSQSAAIRHSLLHVDGGGGRTTLPVTNLRKNEVSYARCSSRSITVKFSMTLRHLCFRLEQSGISFLIN